MNENTNGNIACCFTGHRDIPADTTNELSQRIKDGVDYLYANTGVTTYYVGGALGFDTLAAEAVIAQRKEHPDIHLFLVIPCAGQAARWSAVDRMRYEHIKSSADELICLAAHYFRGCMHQRNRYMVDYNGPLVKTTQRKNIVNVVSF